MERFIRFFVERHLLVHVITASIVMVGLRSAKNTNIEGFPSTQLPRFVVNAQLPGAAARDVETKITIPIEDELREVDGLDSYTTVITDNRSVTQIELDDDTPDAEIAEKEREVRTALDAVRGFPEDMRDDPTLVVMNPNKQPILEVALAGESKSLPAAALRVERALLRVEGVGEIEKVGLPDPELRVYVDPQAARAHGVTLLDVVRAIAGRNVSDTGGVLESSSDRRQVVLWGRFEKPEEVGDVVLRFEEEGPLYVRDVARLELGREDVQLLAGTNGEPGLSLIVVKRAGADVIETQARIVDALARLELPNGVTTSIVNDMSYEMRNRMNVLYSNGIMGIILVVAILFTFLAPSAAIWVAAGVPIVILGVIAVMPFTGMTINFVSTTAFVIVLGMLVDDAVVVAEMILVKRQEGLPPAEAAVQGALAVSSPVFASAATTVLAFAPLLAIGGMSSRVVWMIPAVVCLSLLLSLAESFVILPAHMAISGSNAKPAPKRAFVLRLEERYRRALRVTLANRGRVIAGFAAFFFLVAFGVIPRLEFEFFPQESAPGFHIKVTMPPGTPIEQTEAVVDVVQAQLPPIMGTDLQALTTRVGHQDREGSGREYGSAENEGIVSAHLDLDKKRKSAAEWIEALRETIAAPLDAKISFEADIDGPPGLEPVNVYVLANDDAIRRQVGVALAEFLRGMQGVVDVSIDERFGIRQIDLNPDPERLARHGLDARMLGQTLKAAYYGIIATEMRDLEETTDVRVTLEPEARRTLHAILDTPVRNERGELVLVRDVVDPVEIPALAKIQHRDGRRSLNVTAGLAADAPNTALTIAERIEREFVPRYANRDDVEIEISGEAVQSRRATGDLAAVGIVVVFGIGAVIAIMLGSLLEALFVIAVVPFAIVAVALTFWLHGMNFSLLPVIGTIGLSGVVVNASIVMVDAVHNAQSQLSRAASEAEREATLIETIVSRLRPILVTTMTTFGGVIPTAYGIGGYDAVMSPMSLALGWGLALSTVVTLFLVPSLYVTANDINRRIATWRGKGGSELAHAD
ncbi:MAG: efflux RND transporter permease subunit [Deltaproteobacteria bacterium]|nr:efflux RND transporter permease subunit [Deltaproteobacteria bacterium]